MMFGERGGQSSTLITKLVCAKALYGGGHMLTL